MWIQVGQEAVSLQPQDILLLRQEDRIMGVQVGMEAGQSTASAIFFLRQEDRILWVKRTVSRDFLLQVFFMNHLPPKPQKTTLGSFQIFSEICGDIHK